MQGVAFSSMERWRLDEPTVVRGERGAMSGATLDLEWSGTGPRPSGNRRLLLAVVVNLFPLLGWRRVVVALFPHPRPVPPTPSIRTLIPASAEHAVRNLALRGCSVLPHRRPAAPHKCAHFCQIPRNLRQLTARSSWWKRFAWNVAVKVAQLVRQILVKSVECCMVRECH